MLPFREKRERCCPTPSTASASASPAARRPANSTTHRCARHDLIEGGHESRCSRNRLLRSAPRSILGDKTRFLTARRFRGFRRIRPSPASGTCGGWRAKTRGILLRGGGFDVVLVETNASASPVRTAFGYMTDFSPGADAARCLRLLPGHQERSWSAADMIAINKADGDNSSGRHLAAPNTRCAAYPPRRAGRATASAGG